MGRPTEVTFVKKIRGTQTFENQHKAYYTITTVPERRPVWLVRGMEQEPVHKGVASKRNGLLFPRSTVGRHWRV